MKTKYSLQWLQSLYTKGEKLKYIYFWGHMPASKNVIDKACFSQWSPTPFTVNGFSYPTAEHWMMAQKHYCLTILLLLKK